MLRIIFYMLATCEFSNYRISGVPACANKKLLTDILRSEWGFEGNVANYHNTIHNITYIAVVIIIANFLPYIFANHLTIIVLTCRLCCE